MTEPNTPRRSSPWVRAVPWAVAAAAVAAAWWWTSRDAGRPEAPAVPAPTLEATAPASAPEPAAGAADAAWREATGGDPVWPDPFEPDGCAQAEAELRALCATLDAREYVGARRLDGGACGLFASVAADLEANLPPVHGELRDLMDVRMSVAHLFRALGGERLAVLAEIVALEPDLAEPAALTLYRWTVARGRCSPPSMGPKARYDYAAWLLRAVGGQAYLRRRLPRQEALVTYYALRVLDDAVESGYDPAGVDLRNDLSRAVGLIEGRDDLRFRDRYLDDLRARRERWSRRTGDARR